MIGQGIRPFKGLHLFVCGIFSCRAFCSNKFLFLFAFLLLLSSCGERILPTLGDGAEEDTGLPTYFETGDIILVAGGDVNRSTSPYPSHKISSFDPSTGSLKEELYSADSTELLWGAHITSDQRALAFTIDGPTDYVATLDPVSLGKGAMIITALSGATMRALVNIADGSWLVAEARNAIEKFNSSYANQTGNGFRMTSNLGYVNRIRAISGDRFMILQSQNGDDRPRVFNNANASSATVVNLGLSCGNNCDIHDVVELPDGRFVFSVMNSSYNSLLITNSSFVVQGELFKDEVNLPGPATMALIDTNNLLVCTYLNGNCEKITVSGNTGSISPISPFISHPIYSRNITDIVVVPEGFYEQ